MDFIRGISLDNLFVDSQSGLLKQDLRDDDIECIYRQMARFMLELFQINFDKIGSIPTPQTGFTAPIRPLTWKAHGILHEGGVDVFGDRNKGFDSATEYFQYLLRQDHQQLKDQPNSATGWRSACEAYASLEVLKSLLPDLVEPNFNHGPFKLICADFGLGNLIVRGHDDLTVVGVVDLEWIYAGPAQLFASGPWWLLGDRPINEAWDYKEGKPPRVASRYMRYLEIFTSVLKEEEMKILGHEKKELSTLVEWSRSTGAMWLHMILSAGFFDCESFPCGQLQRHHGLRWWLDTLKRFEDREEVKVFAQGKELELKRYDERVDRIEELKSLMDDRKLTREDFVAQTRSILARKPDDAND
ncbi:uncharacterized protein N7459_005038 [Penicillium hispanicum]|uniref:uncharacterized protein n=1 Tax=Penicillium hispanicum TaxID=1080232 RepID=UPI002541EE46|nr:uncharacterized protein N7459_005038 [Penicillium hispanicum]KAJ5585238.1 hypothetical protein N7459_005038 [Penicillium hispanicum]